MSIDNEPEPWTYVGTMPDTGIVMPTPDEKALYVQIGQLGEELAEARGALSQANAMVQEQREINTALRQEIAALGQQLQQERLNVEDEARRSGITLDRANEAYRSACETVEELRAVIAAAQEQIQQDRADMAALQHSHEVRIERIAEVLHEAGERQGWCSTYDAILADAGLPARQRDYAVDVNVTLELGLTLTVTAGGYDAARETLTQDMVRAALDLGSHLPEGDVSWDVTEVEAVDE